MKKCQGSLEYVMVFAGVLMLAVMVALVANTLLGFPIEASGTEQEKYDLLFKEVEVIGYEQRYDGTPATAPTKIIFKSAEYVPIVTDSVYKDGNPVFELNSYPAYHSPSQGELYLCESPDCEPCKDGCGEVFSPCIDECYSPNVLCSLEQATECAYNEETGCLVEVQLECHTDCCPPEQIPGPKNGQDAN